MCFACEGQENDQQTGVSSDLWKEMATVSLAGFMCWYAVKPQRGAGVKQDLALLWAINQQLRKKKGSSTAKGMFAGWSCGELIDFLFDKILCQKAAPVIDEIISLKLTHKNEQLLCLILEEEYILLNADIRYFLLSSIVAENQEIQLSNAEGVLMLHLF